MKFLFRCLSFCLGSVALVAVTANAEIETLPDRIAATGWSGVLLVEDASGIILHEAFGEADLESNTPVEADTRFPIASITKVFTAAIVLQLVEEGLIELDEPVSRYLPRFGIDAFEAVTVHQLLNHTSGLVVTEAIKDGDSTVALPYQSALDNDELIARYLDAPLRDGGAGYFEYNNADYMVLGAIIEAVTDQSFNQQLKARILEPLNLSSSGLIEDSADLAGLARGYRITDGSEEPAPNPPMALSNYFTAGGMYSNAADVSTFFRGLFDGGLLSDESVAQLIRTYPNSANYAYGAQIRYPRYGRTVPKVLRRYGKIHGYTHLVSHFIDEGITIVVLANTDRMNATVFEETIGPMLLD